MKNSRLYITEALKAMGYWNRGVGLWLDEERGISVVLDEPVQFSTLYVDGRRYPLATLPSMMAFYRLGEHIVEFGTSFKRPRDAQVAFRSLLTALENLKFDPTSINW